jgi:hypothetical protein
MQLTHIVGFGIALALGGCSGADGVEADVQEGSESSGTPESSVGSQVPGAPESFSSNEALSEASALGEKTGKLGLLIGPSMELLATLDLVEGGQVNFIKDPKGILTVSQIYRATDAEPISAEDMKRFGPAEIWRRLAPERAVPAALLEAEQEFARPDLARGGIEPVSEVASNVETSVQDDFGALREPIEGQLQHAVVDDSKCPAAKFKEKYCGGPAGNNLCKLTRTGDEKIARDDAAVVLSYACSYRGKIGHRLDVAHWSDWEIVKDVILEPGWVEGSLSHAMDILNGDFTFEAIINRATGDGWNQNVFFY